MHCELYTEKDRVWVENWLNERALTVPPEDETPQVGIVVRHGIIPVCMGFLRRIEGGYAQIDGLISNPKCDKDMRNKAIDLLIKNLIDKAKALKIKGICSYSIDKNTIERSTRHGFTVIDHKVLALIISNNQ